MVGRVDRERFEDVLLVGEVEVEGAVAGAGLLGDVVDARGRVTALEEHLSRGLEQLHAGALALLTDDPFCLDGLRFLRHPLIIGPRSRWGRAAAGGPTVASRRHELRASWMDRPALLRAAWRALESDGTGRRGRRQRTAWRRRPPRCDALARERGFLGADPQVPGHRSEAHAARGADDEPRGTA